MHETAIFAAISIINESCGIVVAVFIQTIVRVEIAVERQARIVLTKIKLHD